METLGVVTLIVAIIGATTGIASLVWQGVAFALEGARVEVLLLVAWMSEDGAIKGFPGSWEWGQPPAPNYELELLAVEVRNKGRSPVSVTSWGVKVGEVTMTYPSDPLMNKPTPYRLESGASETWLAGMEQALNIARVLTAKKAVIRAEVGLATGKVVGSSNHLMISNAGAAGAALEVPKRRSWRMRNKA